MKNKRIACRCCKALILLYTRQWSCLHCKWTVNSHSCNKYDILIKVMNDFSTEWKREITNLSEIEKIITFIWKIWLLIHNRVQFRYYNTNSLLYSISLNCRVIILPAEMFTNHELICHYSPICYWCPDWCYWTLSLCLPHFTPAVPGRHSLVNGVVWKGKIICRIKLRNLPTCKEVLFAKESSTVLCVLVLK